jgi:ribose 5-phosphate isomerase A
MTNREYLKRQAALCAAEEVRPGMVVGLGHGSTAAHAIRRIAERLAAGELPGLAAVPCSLHVERVAARLGIPITTLERSPVIDVTIDGADEVDPDLDLIKGGGGALLREKIVAQASRQVLIIVDDSKLSSRLGERWALPVEVVPFGWPAEAAYLESLGAWTELRKGRGSAPFVTDQGNYLLDCHFGPLEDKVGLAALLDARAGIMVHGLFLGVASAVLVAGPGGVRRLARDR